MVATSLAKHRSETDALGRVGVHFVRRCTVTLLLGDSGHSGDYSGCQSDRVIRDLPLWVSRVHYHDNADRYRKILLERGKVIADYEAQ